MSRIGADRPPGAGGRPVTLEVIDLFCNRAQYLPGEPVRLHLDLENGFGTPVSVHLHFAIMRLEHLVEEVDQEEVLAPGRSRLTVEVAPRTEQLAGFGVDLSLEVENGVRLRTATAFDVAADPHARMRYGFLSDFTTKELGRTDDVELLAKLHINYVQFYDWMYRHDELIPPQRHFTDPMGKSGDLDVVREKIGGCRDAGIHPVAYGAVYAATTDYFEKHRDQALYHRDGSPYCFIERFYIMNIARDSPWSRHIVGQFQAVVDRLGFSGIHMDTYGFPKRALAYRAGPSELPTIVRLDEEFTALISRTRTALGGEATLIFNNVGGWPVDATAGAPQNAVYIEVWSPHTRYHHLVELIAAGRRLGGGKPVILAAYLLPFKHAKSEQLLIEAEQSALLATAVITSAGGYHLLLGEAAGLLTEAYYVDHATLRPDFLRTMRGYYDFIVRYSDLFFDNESVDVTSSHLGVEFPDYLVDGVPVTQTGDSGRVWVTVRESQRRVVVNFVNLVGLEHDEWNKGHRPPHPQRGIRFAARVLGEVAAVYTASPDLQDPRPLPLEYTRHTTFDETAEDNSSGGEVLAVTLPELRIWSVLVIELAE